VRGEKVFEPDTLRPGDATEEGEWMVPMGILDRESSRKRSYEEGQGVLWSAVLFRERAAVMFAWSRSTSIIAREIDL
jgi:hypothetical protein